MKVFKCVELLKKTYDRLLNEIAKQYDLTLMDIKILIFLDGNKSKVAKDIVEGIKATKSHVSMSVCNLEQKGYIEKSPDEKDRKKSHLKVTKKANKIIEEGKTIQSKLKEIMLEDITEEELKVLSEISKKFENNLEKYNKM